MPIATQALPAASATAAQGGTNPGSPRHALLYSGGPTRAEYTLLGLSAAFCWLVFAHPDIRETARHAYILIRSTLDGEFLQFFENTFTRTYGYAYTNAAHYNILMYILYALWELPLFLVEKIGGFAFSDRVLSLWCKGVGAAFFAGCGLLMGRLAKRTGCCEKAAAWAPLLFWLSPVAFFTTMVMGQYDSICLFFLLWALCFYFDKRYIAFSLIMGVGMVFKFFPLFLLLPLLLLVEKRPLRLAGLLAASMWLYLPTTGLFMGRTGDASFFNQLMVQRLFDTTLPTGMAGASAFGLAMVLLCVAAYLYRPAGEAQLQSAALYSGLAVFSALFFFVYWHPQWIILLVPFLLLTTLRQREKTPFVYVEGAFYVGFFLLVASAFPAALEANMVDFGALQPLLGLVYAGHAAQRTNAFYFALIPYLNQLAPLLFYGALAAGVAFKLPLGGVSLADGMAAGGGGQKMGFSYRLYAWGCFALALGGFWAAPTLFGYLKTFGIL